MWCDYAEVKKKFYPGVDRLQSVKELFEHTAILGDQVYLIDAVTGDEYSYADSNRMINKVSHALMGLGLKKGDRVGFFMLNSPRCVFTLLGIMKVGMIVVPINPAFREKETEHLINQAQISTIIVDPNQAFLNILANISKENEVLKRIIIYGQGEAEVKTRLEALHMEDLLEQAGEDNPDLVVKGGDPCVIFFTSGTTGLPKGAPVSNQVFLLAAQSALCLPWTGGHSRNYTCLPLFHANCQVYSVTGMRCLGAALVLSDRFSPKKFFDEINRYQATFFNSIGGMMQMLNAAFESKPVPEHTAKYVLVGGTPVSLWRSFEERFKVTILEGYSQSEAPVVFFNADPDPARRKIGSFGIPVFPDLDRKTKILLEDGREAPAGEEVTGELLQKGFTMQGYWGEEEKTKEAIKDGWLYSGDLVRRDPDGYHYFVDRIKFMIRKAGENIPAFDIEAAVNSYPGVSEASVVPVPDPLREEEIKAFIKPAEGVKIDIPDLIRHCAERLSYFKVPRYVEIVDSFPKTATERIQKMELKDMEKKKADHGWDRDREIPDWRDRFYGK